MYGDGGVMLGGSYSPGREPTNGCMVCVGGVYGVGWGDGGGVLVGVYWMYDDGGVVLGGSYSPGRKPTNGCMGCVGGVYGVVWGVLGGVMVVVYWWEVIGWSDGGVVLGGTYSPGREPINAYRCMGWGI